MASWNFDQFQKHIESVEAKKSELSPFYLFFGEEIYLMNQAVQLLKTKIFEDSSIDFNYDAFYGSEIDMDQVSSAVETLPMMGARRLVLLKEAEKLKTNDLEKIADVVSVPYDTTVFVLCFEKIDQRKKIFKDLFKKMTVVDFAPINERLLTSWVDRIVRGYGKTILPKASLALQSLVGHRLIDLDNEINKLSSYVGEKKQIDIPDIEAVVSKYRLDSIFELTNAIADKDAERALKIQKYLLDQGESEVGILAMITRHIRLLMLTAEALQNKLPSSEMASYVGVPPFFLNQYLSQSKLWQFDKLQRSFANLLKVDRNLKSSSIPSENFLIHNILDLTSNT